MLRARESSVNFLDRFFSAFKVLKVRIVLADAQNFKRIEDDCDDFFSLRSSVADEEERRPAEENDESGNPRTRADLFEFSFFRFEPFRVAVLFTFFI